MKKVLFVIVGMILLLIAIKPVLSEENSFPDVSNLQTNKMYDKMLNIAWDMYDVDGDGLIDVGIGYIPIKEVITVITPYGKAYMLNVNKSRVDYRWIDRNKDNSYYKDDMSVDWSEIDKSI